MSSERNPSYLRPLPLNEHPRLRPILNIPGLKNTSEAIKPILKVEQTDPTKIKEFKELSPDMQRWTRRGITLGWISNTAVRNKKELHSMREDFEAARHENKHDKVRAWKGASRIMKSIIPNYAEGYRAVVKFTLNPNRSRVDQIEDSIPIALASSVEDNMEYQYDRSGRGSDLASAWRSAQIVSSYKYRGNVSASSIYSSAMSEASNIVNDGGVEEDSWYLMDQKEVA